VDLVNSILSQSCAENQHRLEWETLKFQLHKKFVEDPAPIHLFYQSHFNYVDLVDRSWNAVEEHHPNHDWKCKMVLTILRFGMINCWTCAIQKKFTLWKIWREKLAKNLADFDINK
jgi:hypothetical protein